MGCCKLCKKKHQEIDTITEKIENNKDDVLIINIGDLVKPDVLLKGNDYNRTESEEVDEDDAMIMKDWRSYAFVFGKNFLSRYKEFLSVYTYIFQLSMYIPTTLFTFGYGDVKKIIDNLKTKISPPIISDKLYTYVIKNKNEIIEYSQNKSVHKAVYELFLKDSDDGTDFQTEIIISTLKFIMLNSKFEENNITCSLAKLFQDMGFCIRILYYSLKNHLLHDRFAYEYDFDIRILYYLNLIENLAYPTEFPSELLKLATESTRIKDTIILGDEDFRQHIKNLNLPNERINDLDDNMLDTFFQTPFLEKNKYKVVKYFIICQYENYEKKYLEEFKLLSSKYGFAYLFLVQLDNIQLVKMFTDLEVQNSVIYYLDDYELSEIYKDNNVRLRPRLREYMKDNFTSFKIDNIKVQEINTYKIIEDLKSSSEDGWDLFEFKKYSLFLNFSFISANFQDFIRHIIGHLIEAYKDHNLLDIFFKHYSNYFFLYLQPEFRVNMTAFAKMFLYAYTLEEGDPNKNLYCIINDDLRSSVPEKINRYIELIKVIGGLVEMKEIKSYDGIVYRASFLKDELIKNIKIGDTITNSAFWSSTKKESVAKKFLKASHKNALIITKGELVNSIDIHSEKISKYPNEEEVLFLPFCNFKIVSFEKVNEGTLNYYKLVLESVSKTSLFEPYNQMIINRYNCEKKEIKDDNDDIDIVINFG